MAHADNRREVAVIGITLQARIGIMLNQRRIGGMEFFAGAQIAEQMRGRGPKRIKTAIETRQRINRDTEFLIIRAALLEFLPRASCQQDAVSIIDIAARNFGGKQVEARIMLWTLYAIKRIDVGIFGEQLLVVKDLNIASAPDKQQRREAKAPQNQPDRDAERGLEAFQW